MTDQLNVDICVIGGGSGGLSVAAGASQMGASVILIEKGQMGGDCLNFGCVPSKSLLATAKARHDMATAGRLGLHSITPEVDMQRVHDHIHDVIAGIAPHDSVERFEGLGVKVIRAEGRFIDHRRLRAGDAVVEARRFVIAAGSSPMVPPIPGLDEVSYLTNETIFAATQLPQHLAVIGGGPIGLELAQAYRRLGARVTVIEMQRPLPKDDPELAEVVARCLRAEGVDIIEGAKVSEVSGRPDSICLTLDFGDGQRVLEATQLLVAAGRRANVGGLNLEAAGVEYSPNGIKVDARLRTSNRRIYAIGDIAGGLQFTHVAGYHAGIVLRNILFRLPAKARNDAIPWVTYTDPELAHVGLTEEQARERGERINILRWPFAENDRARTERSTDGFVKVVVSKRGRILGASIAGRHAGELIQPWVLAIDNGLKISKMAGYVAPYPTLGEAGKRAASSFYVPKLFTDRTRRLVRFLAMFG